MSDIQTPGNMPPTAKNAPPKGVKVFDRPERQAVQPVVMILGLLILAALVIYFLFYYHG